MTPDLVNAQSWRYKTAVVINRHQNIVSKKNYKQFKANEIAVSTSKRGKQLHYGMSFILLRRSQEVIEAIFPLALYAC